MLAAVWGRGQEFVREAPLADPAEVKRQITEIKSSGVYFDTTRDASASWLQNSSRNFWEMMKKLFDREVPNLPQINMPRAGVSPSLIASILYGILGVVLVFVIYHLVRTVRIKRGLKRRASALLEEDEPERSLDEWLALSEQLAAEGDYRRAVRCLYLACLLKFDEHRVARFDRSQTNWEHLARIQTSPTRPSDLDFKPATQAFDRIWYGYRDEGQRDVERFRAWYLEFKGQLEARRKEVPA